VGIPFAGRLRPGTCIRLNTGARIPFGVNRVDPIEGCTLHEADPSQVRFPDSPSSNDNIRRAGEEARRGEVLLGPGARCGPAVIGLLRSIGVESVLIHPPPRVAILTTGDEFSPGGPAARPDANGPLLMAACEELGAIAESPTWVPDDPATLHRALTAAIGRADLVLSTGGASVGPHDHLRGAWENIGIDVLFHRIVMKPGKPTHAGIAKPPGRQAVVVLGLPGNPLAALTAFELLAAPVIEKMMGGTRMVSGCYLPLSHPIPLGPTAQFVRVERIIHHDGHAVHAFPAQNSGMLRWAAASPWVAYLPPTEHAGTVLSAGTPVWVDRRCGGSWPTAPL
jgi:molybdopterin molybdotransferase